MKDPIQTIQCGPGATLTFDINDRVSPDGRIRYIGKATRREDGSWTALADVDGKLCVVEIKLRAIYES